MTRGGSDDKRAAIVAAAAELFGRYGFKRASMDLIAAEAGVAKATVYAYFSSKDEVFRGVVEHVARTFLDAAEAARAEAFVPDRLVRMLQAKFTYLFQLVHSSPHAAELLGSQRALDAGDGDGPGVIAKADRKFLHMLAHELEAAVAQADVDLSRVDMTPLAAARVLYRSAFGANHGARTAAAHRRNLAELVAVFWAAVRA